jgi:dolichol-phosphate mannosyltransferase
VSIIIPAYNESEIISLTLSRIAEFVSLDFECLVVVDSSLDSSVAYVHNIANKDKRFKVIVNNLGKGPAFAIRAGIEKSNSNTIVVTMADGSDDPRDIEELVLLIERGVHVACASRYMATGQQIGAPLLKSFLSKFAGKSLQILVRIGTSDATNSFKAYNREFLDVVDIESKQGFEMGLEMVAKAHRMGFLVAEIPTIWIERKGGQSNFKLMAWIPKYLRWYFTALGFRNHK